MKKHYFFDLDNTLAPSRGKADEAMVQALHKLPDVIIVSGVERKQLQKQFPNCPYYVMSQNGNLTYKEDEVYWQDFLTWQEQLTIFSAIKDIIGNDNNPDLVEDRGCQISLSMIGHNSPKEQKLAYDPDGSKRRAIIAKHFPNGLEGIDIKIGGTTCLDFFRAGGDKGNNIERFIKFMDWKKENCIYFGDALFSGGNDESVIGVIDTVQVKNPAETLEIISKVK